MTIIFNDGRRLDLTERESFVLYDLLVTARDSSVDDERECGDDDDAKAYSERVAVAERILGSYPPER